MLLTVTPLAGNDSKVGSAPLFARKNLPSLDDVPCGSLASVTAWSAILSVVTLLFNIFDAITALSTILFTLTALFNILAVVTALSAILLTLTALLAMALVSTALSASSLASIWFAGIFAFVIASSLTPSVDTFVNALIVLNKGLV